MASFSRFSLIPTALASTLLLADLADAHGGQYRGPGDVVPPGPGGRPGTPSAPGPRNPGGAPTTPPGVPGGQPPAPATGLPGPGPGGRPGTRTGGPGMPDVDLTQWTFWWEFNKDPFLRLKDAIHSPGAVTGSELPWLGHGTHHREHSMLRPTRKDTVHEILPALKKAIDSTDQNDITSACMVAMAKIGEDHPEFALRDVFVQRLARKQQEVREVAALSLGIAAQQRPEAMDLLVALATDAPGARKLCDQTELDDRTRSFATYGLGLLAHAHADVRWKRLAFAPLRSIVEDRAISSRNLKVAAIEAIGILAVDASEPEGKALLAEALRCLETYYTAKLGVGEQLLQAHCPTAIAKLLTGSRCEEATIARYEELFAAGLARSEDRRSHDLARACAMALGQLCSPVDDDASPDAAHCDRLLHTFREHKDAQTRYFAVLALGQIGGARNRSMLLKEWRNAGDSLEKPWLALALGCLEFERREAEVLATGIFPDVDQHLGELLRDGLDGVKDPLAVGAFAIGLGLVGHRESGDDLRALLQKHLAKDELAGHLCIGLALMQDQRSIDEIRGVLKTSLRRPERLRQAAVALGKLGDKTVADELLGLLEQRDHSLSTLSAVASALGFIGDRRSIAPLRTMLLDESLTPLTRAFAAVALGGVGDKERLPWNSKIAVNTNYRAAVETLTDGQAGILDIL